MLINRFVNIFLVILGALLIDSCSLKYHAPETPEAFEVRRQAKVKDHILIGLGTDTADFEIVAFGQSKTIRPTSFRKLDSLYEIKYQNELKGTFDRELEQIITIERETVGSDTSTVNYLEDVVFSFRSVSDTALGSSQDHHRYVDMSVSLDHDLNATILKVNGTILIPDSLDEMYRRFLFEESFLYPGSLATEEEINFYRFFKNEIEQHNGTNKDLLTLHTLKVMNAAYSRKTLNTNRVLYKLAILELDRTYLLRYNEEFSDVFSTSQNTNNGIINGYWLTVRFQTSREGPAKELFLQFDHLYRLISITEL